MIEISDSLRFLSETTLEKRGDEIVIPLPEDTTLSADEVYRVALMDVAQDGQDPTQTSSTAGHEATSDTTGGDDENRNPPVETGDVRSVTIESLGDQGDGVAKVERGFIVFVPGTKPGDRLDVEITTVNDSVAFAEPVSRAEVR